MKEYLPSHQASGRFFGERPPSALVFPIINSLEVTALLDQMYSRSFMIHLQPPLTGFQSISHGKELIPINRKRYFPSPPNRRSREAKSRMAACSKASSNSGQNSSVTQISA